VFSIHCHPHCYFPQRGYRIKPTTNRKATGTGAGQTGRVRPRARLALGPPRRVVIDHVDAFAPHKDEVTEAEDAEWDADADEDAPSHEEEAPGPPTTRKYSRPTRMKPRKLRTPHKDEATEAEDAEWDPHDDEDRRMK